MPLDQLKNYGTLEYAFVQRALVPQLPQDEYGDDSPIVQHGLCTALVALWLKEKLTTSTSSSGADPTRFVGASTDAANFRLVREAAPYQITYHKALADIDAMLNAMGLAVRMTMAVPSLAARSTVNDLAQVAIEVATLLQSGRGVLIELTVHDATTRQYLGRHVVGMYLSRGDSLYFFEPNAGVFLVNKKQKELFFREWVQSSRTERNWVFEMNTTDAPLRPADRVYAFWR